MDVVEKTRPDAETLIARARELAPMLLEHTEEVDKNRRISDEVFASVREAELLRTIQPAMFGGFEHDWRVVTRVIFELGQGCPSTAWVSGAAMCHQWLLAKLPIEAQQEIWAGNSDSAALGSYAPSGVATKVDGGYKISGSWKFASGCDNADWLTLGVRLPLGDDGEQFEPGLLALPFASATIEDDWYSMGMVGTGSKTIHCEDVFIPEHFKVTFREISVGITPGGLAHNNTLYNLPFMSCLPYGLAVPALGALQRAIDDFTHMAKVRKTRGAVMAGGTGFGSFANVQTAIGHAKVALDAAKLLVERDLRELQEQGATAEGVSIDLRIRNRLTQAYILKLAKDGINGIMEATGGNALYLSNPIQRSWRDINAASGHISFNWAAASTLYGQHVFGMEPMGQY
jgi:alkylation response protein AidB-like acyl-CoA dehydrogenase